MEEHSQEAKDEEEAAKLSVRPPHPAIPFFGGNISTNILPKGENRHLGKSDSQFCVMYSTKCGAAHMHARP